MPAGLEPALTVAAARELAQSFAPGIGLRYQSTRSVLRTSASGG